MRKLQASAGFTLIELLIVIVIVGIIASVLIPNILNARKHAYDTISMNCANSLSKAAALYKVDYPMSTSYPDVADFVADPTHYGTNTCQDPNLDLDNDTPSGSSTFVFSVRHLYGNKKFTVQESGMSITAQ